ncbi:MAG: UDP-N-acetylmuramyl-tripeptide synthetase [Patescibacteria group bacterium]
MIKKLIRKITPKFLISWYHLILAYVGACFYGFPSKKMIVIGVLGTRGKTTVANLIWSCFTAAGYKTGLTGTANIRIGDEERMNPYHMTMPGRFTLQRLLKEMYDKGCRCVVVETPSEGVEQWRHKGIAYDAAVMTTLYPEYLAVHNWSFERCKDMDEKIFEILHLQPRKKIGEKNISKVIVVNNEIEEKERFLKHKSDIKVTYAIHGGADIVPEKINISSSQVSFSISGVVYTLGILGDFNVGNALAAIATVSAYGVSNEAIQNGLQNIRLVPGRMEKIDEGQKFSVFVDYAHDAVSIEAALLSIKNLKKEKEGNVIVLLGGQGGGRDKKKRPIMGQIAAQMADYVVITNEDPYQDDPVQIMEEVARGSEDAGKIRGKDLFVINDRREGIKKALSLATSGDAVLIAGKGAEQSMEVKEGQIPWDDRVVVKEELKLL